MTDHRPSDTAPPPGPDRPFSAALLVDVHGRGSVTLTVVPVTFRQACAFIAVHHRHHRPPQGMKFALGVAANATVVGVAVVGRPVARHLDDGRTAEVTRSCTDGTPNANSKLYAAAWRAARALGYQRLITYTESSESGASLRAAGFRPAASCAPHRGWDRPSRRRERQDRAVARTRWEIARASVSQGTAGTPPDDGTGARMRRAVSTSGTEAIESRASIYGPCLRDVTALTARPGPPFPSGRRYTPRPGTGPDQLFSHRSTTGSERHQQHGEEAGRTSSDHSHAAAQPRMPVGGTPAPAGLRPHSPAARADRTSGGHSGHRLPIARPGLGGHRITSPLPVTPQGGGLHWRSSPFPGRDPDG